MKNLPSEHKNVMGFAILILILTIAVYYFFVAPIVGDVQSKHNTIVDLKSKLQKTKWPLDPERLSKMLEIKNKELDGNLNATEARNATGVRQRANLVLNEATGMFMERIANMFAEPADFVDEVSRLDYQEEFNLVEEKLAKRGIYVSGEVMNISENTTSDYIYQLVLQIWGVDILTEIITKNKMKLAYSDKTIKDDKGKSRRVSKIQVMPVKGCFLYEGGDVYVYEFPYRMVLQGDVSNLYKLLAEFQEKKNFIPVSHMQIFVSPSLKQRASKLYLEPGTLTVELECSLFFIKPNSKGSEMKKTKIKQVAPAGV